MNKSKPVVFYLLGGKTPETFTLPKRNVIIKHPKLGVLKKITYRLGQSSFWEHEIDSDYLKNSKETDIVFIGGTLSVNPEPLPKCFISICSSVFSVVK
jgi:hypothetical protein